MPWVNEEMCVGCGVCTAECPVSAIGMEDDKAVIDDARCIRCGKCHEVCPHEAVRHDSERIPQEVEANLSWAGGLMKHCSTDDERSALVDRLKRFFKKEIKVAEKSMERLNEL